MSADLESVNLEDITILIVEDETIVSLDLQSRLESLGYEVLGTIDNGEGAVNMA